MDYCDVTCFTKPLTIPGREKEQCTTNAQHVTHTQCYTLILLESDLVSRHCLSTPLKAASNSQNKGCLDKEFGQATKQQQ